MAESPIKTQPTAISQAELDLSSPTFEATRYLAATHANTTFLQLQTTLAALSKITSDKTAQLKALVSAHFDQYLSCHEAVRTLAADVSLHHQDTEALMAEMHNLNRVTDASLAVMLLRTRKQRQIRHTLAVLARLRPILELTSKMKSNLLIQDYDTLAVEYTRLKHQSVKLGSLATPLKRVVIAGYDIAATANTELLKKLEDMTASVADQKHNIKVLIALGLVENPLLICITKQFEYLERKLMELDSEDASQITVSTHNSGVSKSVIEEYCAGVARFRNGLWGFICELFNSPAGNMAAAGKTITSIEAERVQEKSWHILSKYIEGLERRASPPSALRLRLLSEAFRQLQNLDKCPNAATLTANIEQLKETFCNKFRTTIILDFLKQECQSAQSQLLTEYFEPVVTVLPSLSSEISIAAPNAVSHSPVMLTNPQTKVQCVIVQARQAFDANKKAFTVSSESKILLHRPQVFTTCATDILERWESMWKNVGHVLLDVLDITGRASTFTGEALSPAVSIDPELDVRLRSQISQALEEHLLSMLSEFLEKLVAAFVAEVNISVHDETYAFGEATSAARVCILFAVVANCDEFREKGLRVVDGWMSQLKYGNLGEDANQSLLEHGRAATSSTRALFNLVQSVESKCMEIYSSSHIEPFKKTLRVGAAEKPLQPHSSSRHSSHTSRSGSVGMSSSLILQSPSSNSMHAVLMPSDPRQYVFNVLLQLITMRGEVEVSVGDNPQCWDYIRTVTDPLVAALAEFLQTSAFSLKGSSILNQNEWTLCHLIVEVSFFQLALSDLMIDSTKAQLKETEKLLLQIDAGNEATKMSHNTLYNQIKHQTKLYLLALQH